MKKKLLNKNQRAFTLFELLLTMSLIAVMFVMSVPLYQNFLYRSEIDDAVNIYYKGLKVAQGNASSGLYDTSWGVAFSNYEIIIFAGSSFSGRNTDHDRVWNIGNRFSLTGLTEITFSKFYGIPSSSGSINITNNGITKTLNINEKGQISY